MSKCSVDIRKDIVDAVTKRLKAKGAYVFEDSGYFGNPNISSSVINGINKGIYRNIFLLMRKYFFN
jgi:hypothetical protein